MKFQGSGFAVDVPDGVIDFSTYVFSYGSLGDLPPNISVRFEAADGVDMAGRLVETRASLESSLPDATVDGDQQIRNRGDWHYFTLTVEFGEAETRMKQKIIHILVGRPVATLYVISGTDYAANFDRFEPAYDALVRSFEPNDIQRLS